jgi:hypothetical protein
MNMWIVLGACLASLPAHAVNKCTMPDGRVVYTDTPCPGAATQAQSIYTPSAPEPRLATPRPPRPGAPQGQATAGPLQALQIPPPRRLHFSALPQSDISVAVSTMDKIRLLGRDCEWALKVDKGKMQACIDFLARVQPGGEVDQIRDRVAQVYRYEPDAARLAREDLAKLRIYRDEVLQYKEIAMARLSLGGQ